MNTNHVEEIDKLKQAARKAESRAASLFKEK